MNKVLKLGRVLCAALGLFIGSVAIAHADAIDKPYYQPISPAGVYRATFQPLADGQTETITMDSTGALRVDCILGCTGSGGSGSLTMPFAGNADGQATGSAQAVALMGFNGSAFDRLKSTSGSLNAHVDNFPTSFNVGNFPTLQGVSLNSGPGSAIGTPLFASLVNLPTAAAGSSNANALTVQGIAGMTPILIDLANFGTSGANPIYVTQTNVPATQNVAETGPGSASNNPLYVADATAPSPCPSPGCTVQIASGQTVGITGTVNVAQTGAVTTQGIVHSTGTLGTAASSGNPQSTEMDGYGANYARLGSTQPFHCIATVGTTSTTCGSLSLNTGGKIYVITAITAQSTTATAGGFAITTSTSNCGTSPIGLYPDTATTTLSYFSAPGNASPAFVYSNPQGLNTPTNTILCVQGNSATNTVLVQVDGFVTI